MTITGTVLFSFLDWPWALALSGLSILSVVVLFLKMFSSTRAFALKSHELDLWLRLSGDYRQILPIITDEQRLVPLQEVGPGFKRSLGYAPDEMVGHLWTEFVHPDDLTSELGGSDRLVSNDMVSYYNRWRHKDLLANGEPQWVWLEWTALCDPVTQKTYAYGRDLTNRFEEEGQMATWAHITNDLMAVCNLQVPIEERKFTWVNDAWARELGWSPTEIYNMRIVDIIDCDAGKRAVQCWEEIANPNQTVACDIHCKHKPSRSYGWTSLEFDGYLYITGRDIGEAKRHELELDKLIVSLEARNADLERFASVAAHQLRSPPRTIAGIAQALKEDYGHLMDDEGLQFLDDIHGDADQMAEIVDGLYKFSTVRTSAEMELEPVDLNKVVQGIKEVRAKRRCTECPIGTRCPHRHLHVDCPSRREIIELGDLPTVLGDFVMLREVFSNLIDNGMKFNESMQKRVLIRGKKLLHDRWLISVSDNGVGIPTQYQGKLFQMFERMHPKYPGTGVGLALVAAIVNKLGGEITVQSEEGSGTTFHFDLAGAP